MKWLRLKQRQARYLVARTCGYITKSTLRPQIPHIHRPLSTTRRVRYRFKAWQICTQYVIIEIVKKIHNNVRTDKIHTHTHTHRATQHTNICCGCVVVCVYKNQMVYSDNTCQKITTDDSSQAE